MKRLSRLCVLIPGLLLLLAGQGLLFAGGSRESGKSDDASDWKLKDFSSLDISAGIATDVRIAPEWSIHALGAPEDLQDLKIVLEGRTLRVGFKPSLFFRNHRKVTVQISLPALENLNLSGAASCVLLWDRKELPLFSISLSGSSWVKGTFIARSFKANLSGSSHAEVIGNPENVEAELSGSSILVGEHLSAKNARVSLSGSSLARFAVSGSLDCRASGASIMNWLGNPQVKADTSGSSRVESGE